jgi:hypothetical protein
MEIPGVPQVSILRPGILRYLHQPGEGLDMEIPGMPQVSILRPGILR